MNDNLKQSIEILRDLASQFMAMSLGLNDDDHLKDMTLTQLEAIAEVCAAAEGVAEMNAVFEERLTHIEAYMAQRDDLDYLRNEIYGEVMPKIQELECARNALERDTQYEHYRSMEDLVYALRSNGIEI